MPVAAIDGVLGIEAVHQWINIDTATTLARLGDESTWPHVRIMDIAGLFDLPPVDDNSEPATEAIGDVPYPSRARSKNVTYTVEVRGQTLQELRAGGAALRAAFGPDLTTGLNPVRLVIVTPDPAYGTQEHAYRARCLQLVQGADLQDKSPNATPTPWVRSVVIGLRLYDPRIYEWDPLAPIGLTTPKW